MKKTLKNTDFTPSFRQQDLVTRAFLLGTASGLRSTFAPTILSVRNQYRNDRRLEGTAFAPFASPNVATLLKIMAVGEFIVDKLPKAPNRIAPLPLAVRVTMGALAGSAVFEAGRGSKLTGALIGGFATLTASYIGFYVRRGIKDRFGLPDMVVALVEDAVGVVIGRQIVQN